MLNSVVRTIATTQQQQREKKNINYVVDCQDIAVEKEGGKVANAVVVDKFLQKHHCNDLLVTFEDIVGCDQAKQALMENIILPFRMVDDKRQEIFKGFEAILVVNFVYDII